MKIIEKKSLLNLVTLFAIICLFASCARQGKVNTTQANSSAQSSTETANTEDMDPLVLNCWKHSREEEKGDNIQIYRPCESMNFPLSRFRGSFDFRDNRDCEFMALHPSDRHYMDMGKWEYDGKILSVIDKTGKVKHRFEIVEVTAEILRMKQIQE